MGTHKTETTSFQSICSSSAEQLLEQGIYFERMLGGEGPGNHMIMRNFQDQGCSLLRELVLNGIKALNRKKGG